MDDQGTDERPTGHVHPTVRLLIEFGGTGHTAHFDSRDQLIITGNLYPVELALIARLLKVTRQHAEKRYARPVPRGSKPMHVWADLHRTAADLASFGNPPVEVAVNAIREDFANGGLTQTTIRGAATPQPSWIRSARDGREATGSDRS